MRRRKGCHMRLLHVVSSLLALAMAAFAQSDRGTITGTVLDQSHSIVPGSTVSAQNVATGAQYHTETTSTGNYTLSQLPVGIYDVSVEQAGFNKFVQGGIRVFSAQTERLDVTLQFGATT